MVMSSVGRVSRVSSVRRWMASWISSVNDKV